MNQERTYSNWNLIRDLARFIAPYKGMFIAGAVIRAISDIAWLYPAIAFASIINLLTRGQAQIQDFYGILLLLLVASVIHYSGHEIAKYFVYQVGEKAGLHAALKTLKHLISLNVEWQEKENSGNKIKRIMHGNQGINDLCRLFVDLLIESSINAVLMVGIIALFDRTVALFMVGYLVSYFIISLMLLEKAKNQSHLVNVEEENVQGQFFEIINNMSTVKWLGLEMTLLKKFKGKIEKLIELIRLRIKYFRTRSGLLGQYNEIFQIGIVAYVIYSVIQGRYEAGFLVIASEYFLKLQAAADELATVTSEFIIQKIRIYRMISILEEVPSVEDSGSLQFPKHWKKLELKNLHFSYQKQRYLHNVNLTIRRGEKIGIVGLSGAGKTTIFKLLLKLYNDYEGEILFDGVSLQQIKRVDYLKHTAVVLQETEVFNLSLADNVTLAGEKHDALRLKRAMEIAHIKEFLSKLPQGINTLIGEKGVKLSGGEKQRVGIARALYKKPQILFLDEATSHLDIDSEEMIQDSLKKFFKDITAVVIAHRLSTIREMDRIIVMKAGRIIEEGSFKALLRNRGEFHRLWKKQLKKDEVQKNAT